MAATRTKLTAAVETYLSDLRLICTTGAATDEFSYHVPFSNLLNQLVYWRNFPAAVWHCKLGGYQVLKKWLSYREQKVLARPMQPEEVQHFYDTARRIAPILLTTTK